MGGRERGVEREKWKENSSSKTTILTPESFSLQKCNRTWPILLHKILCPSHVYEQYRRHVLLNNKISNTVYYVQRNMFT